MQFWALVVDSFREARNSRIFWLLLIISLFVTVALLSIGIDGTKITFLFGLWSVETGHFNPLTGGGRSQLIGVVAYLVKDVILGWIGLMLIIVATAGMIPAMTERGAVDAILSKPIGRPMLFLYKYLAVMVFVLVQAAVFVVLTFLVMGFRWGVWAPGYLWSIPLVVLLFSYVFCISAYVGIRTRSAMASVIISLLAWILYAVPGTSLGVFEQFPEFKKYERLYRSTQILTWIPPKTADISYIAARWSGAGVSADIFEPALEMNADNDARTDLDRARRQEEAQLKKSPWLSIGSSLLFEGVVVLLAMWTFCRRDY